MQWSETQVHIFPIALQYRQWYRVLCEESEGTERTDRSASDTDLEKIKENKTPEYGGESILLHYRSTVCIYKCSHAA